MARPAASQKKPNPSKNIAVRPPEDVEEIPAENVEIIRESLGVDVTKESPERVRELIAMRASISSSPYPSPEMLAEYAARGFPDLVPKIISVIDTQRQHRQEHEKKRTDGSETRLNRSQMSATTLGFFGLAGALVGGYFHVPTWICIVVALISVGGPNAATVISRIVDRMNKLSS